MIRLFRAAFVIARRDFTATVLSKAFIFFLLGPMFPVALGIMFGNIGAKVAAQTESPVIAVIADDGQFERLVRARDSLSEAVEATRLVRLERIAPGGDPVAQERALLNDGERSYRGVLSGGLDRPRLSGPIENNPGLASQMRLIIDGARVPEAATGPPITLVETASRTATLSRDRARTAQLGATVLFILSILLSGMLLSQLIEEKSNKIIEVIAAAVPIDAMFIGKLFAMLGASVVGLILWLSLGALAVQSMKVGGVASLPPPAVGWQNFMILGVLYFAMQYLLLGALFMSVGALASTAREVQILSMPVTFAQVANFGFATSVVGTPDSALAIGAAAFPLSSPMAMIARAAERPEIWPHVAGLAWQALWVGIILHYGARLFRRTVLKSGPQRPWWKRARA